MEGETVWEVEDCDHDVGGFEVHKRGYGSISHGSDEEGAETIARALNEVARLSADRERLLRSLEEQTRTVEWAFEYDTDSFGDAPRSLREFDPAAFEDAERHHAEAKAVLDDLRGEEG